MLLRGVNVGRGNRIAMRDLVLLLEGLGCGGVVTHGGSGNAVVDADPAGLPERVEQALQQFGLPVRVLVRTADELAAVVAANPFPELVERPKQLHVAFLTPSPRPRSSTRLGGGTATTSWSSVTARSISPSRPPRTTRRSSRRSPGSAWSSRPATGRR